MKKGSSRRRGLPERMALATLALLVTLPAAGAWNSDIYVPGELEPWRAWVLHGREFRDCPFFFDRTPSGPENAVCAWPGELELSVTSDEARFSQSWTLYAADQWIPLPGDRERWPEAVTADGERIPVVMRKTGPAVRLPPGMHELAGRIAWVERPRALAVPPQTGLLRLTVDGRRIVHPDRARNTVWLGEREAPARAADAIDVKVYRLLSDDVPTRLYTRFTMEVSGSLREEHLRPALPEGFIPAALESELPARLEPGGDLRLQVRPGVWQVELEARAGQVLNEIAAPKPEENLPDSEIWSYRSADRLRVTVPEGPAPVDPLQVSVPEAYLTLPAFRVEPGDTLTIVERSRGRTAGDNALHLQRLLWLDFDGGGYTFSDKLEGRLQSWRLDMAAPYALQNATEDERNLLITAGPEVGWTGVELRQPEIDLRAYGRADTRDAMPASGWQTRLDGLTVELNLPPGQKLLAAPGADRAPGAWAERWKLLDFFLVLIITLATARMFGRPAGAVALAALVLSWHESGAAQWAWLNALVAFALVRVAPAGRLRGAALLYRGASLLGLLLLVIPFFAEEVRLGIYPQLEPQRGPSAVRALVTPPQPEAPAAAGAARNVARPRAVQPEPLEEIAVTGVRQGFQSYARYAPNAIVQAGPGRPSWSWNTYDLYWSGPVGPERTLDLLILPRWLVSLLRFLDVLLLAALAALFVIEALRRNWRYPRRRGDAAASPLAFALGLFMTGALLAPPPASAETPPPEILEQLEQRLLEPPPCAPRCAELTSAHADVGRDALTVELEVHALENVAMSLPGSLDGWRPERLVIDGAPAPHVYRRGDQTLWIRVTEGRHRVVLEGPLPPVETLEVPFPAPPRVFTANARGWALAGVHERRLSAGSLTLTRLHENGDTQPGTRWESSRFPEFVRVERLIELDLEWRVTTTVHRVAPRQGAITIEIPLLAGASLLTADLPVHDGRVRVSFAPSDNVVEWASALPRRSPLRLHMAEDAPWKEVWRFGIGNIWHASFSGVPESEPADPEPAIRMAEFYPRGGESLTLTTTRPEATRGTTLAFDAVTLATEVGARSRNAAMTLDYRATRGAQHVIRLPRDADAVGVSIDGADAPLRADDGELSLPILPGRHSIELRWRRDAEVGAIVRTPAVDLGADAGNIGLHLDLPPSRWVLATSGPRLGPAVMYWSELAAMILFAVVLGRTTLTPLKTRQWLLLGLGFSTFSWPVLLLVTFWLLAVGARGRGRAPGKALHFNALQVAFGALTIVALIAIVVSVPAGLLGAPDMHVAGNGSYGNGLRWFADRSSGAIPQASAFSLPLWAYKGLILAWALWLSFALLKWLPWVWRTFASQGLWRRPSPVVEGTPAS